MESKTLEKRDCFCFPRERFHCFKCNTSTRNCEGSVCRDNCQTEYSQMHDLCKLAFGNIRTTRLELQGINDRLAEHSGYAPIEDATRESWFLETGGNACRCIVMSVWYSTPNPRNLAIARRTRSHDADYHGLKHFYIFAADDFFSFTRQMIHKGLDSCYVKHRMPSALISYIITFLVPSYKQEFILRVWESDMRSSVVRVEDSVMEKITATMVANMKKSKKRKRKK